MFMNRILCWKLEVLFIARKDSNPARKGKVFPTTSGTLLNDTDRSLLEVLQIYGTRTAHLAFIGWLEGLKRCSR